MKTLSNLIVKHENKILNIMFFELGVILTLLSLILMGWIDNKIIPSII